MTTVLYAVLLIALAFACLVFALLILSAILHWENWLGGRRRRQ